MHIRVFIHVFKESNGTVFHPLVNQTHHGMESNSNPIPFCQNQNHMNKNLEPHLSFDLKCIVKY